MFNIELISDSLESQFLEAIEFKWKHFQNDFYFAYPPTQNFNIKLEDGQQFFSYKVGLIFPKNFVGMNFLL